MSRAALHIAAFAILCPVTGWAQDSGADAFAARDYALAATLWQQEAAAGDAEAMLGLGLLADRGFGQRRDFDTAFDWYAQAAALGLAEAQFNIAIMYDAGLGRDRDAAAAMLWYSRAALRGHARAQYNLGLLYESGDGVTPNPTLAAYWFEKGASAVPAAAAKDITVAPATSGDEAPEMAFGQVDDEQIELVWQSGASGAGSYLIEVVEIPAPGQDYTAPLVAQTTTGSGFLGDGTPLSQTALWRVSALSNDKGDYAASDWQGHGMTTPPRARVTLVIDPEVPGMDLAAAVFADDLQEAGYWVRLYAPETPATGSDYISFGYASDGTEADILANYLPVAPDARKARQIVDTTLPGEIRVNLAAFRAE